MLSSSPEVQEVHSRGKGNSAHSLQYALSARTGHRDNKSPNIKMALNDSCFCWQLEKLQLHSQLSSPEEKQLPENVMPSFWESSRRAVIVNLICFWWFGGNLTMLFLHFSRPLAKKKKSFSCIKRLSGRNITEKFLICRLFVFMTVFRILSPLVFNRPFPRGM